MALRYLARRVCTPAIQQRALVPRVPPSAGSRPLSTRGSGTPRPQGGLTNESADAASKGKKEPLTDEQICQKLDEVSSTYKSAIEDLKEFARYQATQNLYLVGSAAAGAGLALLHISYNIHKITSGAKGI